MEMTVTEYLYKTEPFAHQREIFDRTKDFRDYALFWEQGCGKSKPTIDTIAHLYEAGEIDAVVVIAPNGVHRNWITDELPAHLPDRVVEKTRAEFWQSSKSGGKLHERTMLNLERHQGLAILAISYDGFMTKVGLEYLRKFFRSRRVLLVIDEGHYIKTPKAQRTKTIAKAGVLAPYKRLLTGTPITKGPFDIYSQIHTLDDQFWRSKGIANFTAFKQYFGIWQTIRIGGGRTFEKLVEYRNVEVLEKWIAEKGHRLTKLEALDLPPKLYSKRYFDLAPEQRRVYAELRATAVSQLAGEEVSAQMAITLLLRLQQITCGYIPGSESGAMLRFEDNPRIEVLADVIDGIGHQAILWARFTEDINQICSMLSEQGRTFVRYDGKVSDNDRAKAKDNFKSGKAEFFVGNPAAGSTGLTLTEAKSVVYYSNSFKLVERLQSEDRPHRIGQTNPVDYVDLIAADTVDDKILSALRSNFDIASQLMGDKLREWI